MATGRNVQRRPPVRQSWPGEGPACRRDDELLPAATWWSLRSTGRRVPAPFAHGGGEERGGEEGYATFRLDYCAVELL
jgi:hypothetical protein